MDKSRTARALVRWYRRGHRDLPWRRTRDPYRIWVAEVMLQQTQVPTVLRYYEPFLERFPSLEALARAPLSRALKAWEGLGYYARCRNLHRAARELARGDGGRFPDTLDRAMALPGVGRSTAGAILAFAFGQAHPILDGNARRVLARLANLAGDPRTPAAERALWALSQDLLSSASDPADFDQALMELGATLCSPRAPDCPACPVRAECGAFRAGTQSSVPGRRRRPPLPHQTIAVGLVWKDGRVLVQRRPPEGLLGGLWEFPGGKREGREALAETVRREVAEELAIQVAVGRKLAVVRHAYTHFRITLHAFHCRHLSGTPEARGCTAWRWVRPEQLRRYAFPRANQRLLEALEAERR